MKKIIALFFVAATIVLSSVNAMKPRSTTKKSDSEAACCSICFEPFDSNKKIMVILTPCYHYICKKCVQKWAQSGKQMAHCCPFCRRDMKNITHPSHHFLLS